MYESTSDFEQSDMNRNTRKKHGKTEQQQAEKERKEENHHGVPTNFISIFFEIFGARTPAEKFTAGHDDDGAGDGLAFDLRP